MSHSISATGPTARELVYTALCAVLMAVGAWLTIPAAVPFTMQTFAVFLAMGLLGWRRGTQAVAVYLLLGLVGLPVFSGFQGGPGVLLGTTGGYLLGFLALGPVYGAVTRLGRRRAWAEALGLAAGLAVCYAFGTAWFMIAYARASGPIGLAAALGWCVLPFVVPDLVKLGLALSLTHMLRPHLH